MKLINAIADNKKLSNADIRKDKELATNIQEVLIWHGLLKGKADGLFGRLSKYALLRFFQIHQVKINKAYNKEALVALYQTNPVITTAKMERVAHNFMPKLLREMESLNFKVFRDNHELNIVYIEGLNSDLSLNCDTPNEYNDLAIVFNFVNGKPVIQGRWLATNCPGKYYTDNAMNAKGALIHRNRQDKAWQFGHHSGHQALIQTHKITVNRDRDRDFRTDGDAEDSGWFGANCHGGWSWNKLDIKRDSAGCKVIHTLFAQQQFMNEILSDPRFRRNNKHVFTVGTLEGVRLIK